MEALFDRQPLCARGCWRAPRARRNFPGTLARYTGQLLLTPVKKEAIVADIAGAMEPVGKVTLQFVDRGLRQES